MQILSLSGLPAKEHRKVLFGVISLMFSVLQAVFCKVEQIRPLYVNLHDNVCSYRYVQFRQQSILHSIE